MVTDYWRSTSVPLTPVITSASARGHENAVFILASSGSATNLDAPIAYYLVTNIKTGQASKIVPNRLDQLTISNLNAMTSYTFTIAAVSVDGISPASVITQEITTGAVPVVRVAPIAAPVDVPAFTISSTSETKTVNNAITGYTITSSGGAIASYAITPAAPAGLTFSTSTGLLSGTPTSIASATAYTITATNATGSATRTFTLTVTGIVYTVGSTGPGGGTIFYVATTPFACGPTLATTCTYLEAAPALWNGGTEDPTRSWANTANKLTAVGSSGAPETATATAIGRGYFNTRAIILQGNSATESSAAALADSHTVTVSGVVYDDWYLPSKDELNQMCKWARGITGETLTNVTTGCSGGTVNTGLGAAGFKTTYYYWSSSEGIANKAWNQLNSPDPTLGNAPTSYDKYFTFHVRAVRSF